MHAVGRPGDNVDGRAMPPKRKGLETISDSTNYTILNKGILLTLSS